MGFPILSNYNFASFGFGNDLLVEMKRCCIVIGSYFHRITFLFLLWRLDSGCYPQHTHFLVRAQLSVFTIMDLSGNITEFHSGTSSHKILYLMAQERGGDFHMAKLESCVKSYNSSKTVGPFSF